MASLGMLTGALALLVAVGPAHAAFSGANGRIAFQTNHNGGLNGDSTIMSVNPDGTGLMSHGATPKMEAFPVWSPDGTRILFHSSGPRSVELYVMNADGSERTQLTDNCCTFDYEGSWSPDGSKIVYKPSGQYGNQIAVMDADGSNQRPLTYITVGGPGEQEQYYNPAWSPDGERIMFVTTRDGNPEIYTMDADDGSDQVRLTNYAGRDFNPAWSPDGSTIAFERSEPGPGTARHVHVMNADGSGVTRLLDHESEDYDPTWSPDGSMIAFVGWANGSEDIWVMNADGSDARQVGPRLSSEQTPDWQSLPGYARPKGAPSVRVPLVVAYRPCDTPNALHGEPLAFGSCNPPDQASEQLTVGTPDANGKPAASLGSLTLRVTPGDVELTAAVTDVRERSDLAAYSGGLRASAIVRTTDAAYGARLTTEDFRLEFDVPCVGGTCEVTTSVDAVVGDPGAVAAGARAIWQLGEVVVRDPGNTPFLRQGVFVP